MQTSFARLLLVLLAPGLLSGLAGCSSSSAAGRGSSSTAAVASTSGGADAGARRSASSAAATADGEPKPAAVGDDKQSAAADKPAAETPVSPEAKKEFDKLQPPTIVATAAPKDGNTITVNAMIGQINGRAIYASTVLEPLEGQLRAWAGTLPQREFRGAAAKLVGERLYQIVFDTLFLGEAERHLSEEERFGLKVNLRMNREELVRRYGAGSEPRADEEMKKKTSKGLEETLNNIRQSMLIRKYQDDVILPKITVSRRDVERFYFDAANYDKYNPKPGRKIRQMRTDGEVAAGEIDKQLAAGKSFAEVAATRFNQFNRDSGGLMVLKDAKDKEIEFIEGEKVFGPAPLNDALLKLAAGQHSPRIAVTTSGKDTYYWLFVEALSEGKRVPLREAQLQIEQQIRGVQYVMLEQRYRKKLFEDAGYSVDLSASNPLAEMNRALVEIALNIYGGAK